MKYRMKRHAVVQPLDESYRYIGLTKNKIAIVDTADFDQLSQWLWYAFKPRNVWYAARKDYGFKPAKTIYMHAFLCGFNEPDHIDGNGLNNRRNNLRACTHSQNGANAKKWCTNTSGFKGVILDKSRKIKKWQAQIMYGGEYRNLGRFATKEEAARAYDEAAKIYHGEFASLNFPQRTEGETA